ncbi:MAG: hypothetical protein GF405_01600 [Candidatus Eisenbacteria bacterium]|nr:hypothetical protein [Candidatus Eisenbacteria bacterium]
MATKSVTVTYSGGDAGTVSPSSIAAAAGDKVDFSADGSKVTFTFPDDRIFGVGYVSVGDGTTESLTVQQNPPAGTFDCDVHCHKVRGPDQTPDLEIEIGG